MQNSVYQIENKIIKSSRGELFFAKDFIGYGSDANIRQVLSRLEKEGVIDRIAFGIYIKPKIDKILGKIYPNLDEIAHQIAKRDKARIVPTGALALYLLGLTTQIPLKTVYLTDGSQRTIKIGNGTIRFKRTVPKTFAIKNELLQLIVQAFKEVGKQEITEDFLDKIKPILNKIPREVLDKELPNTAVWIQKEVNNLRN